MSETLTVEFLFDIGDIVYSRASNHDCVSRPHQHIVLERFAQQCHADTQLLYKLLDWKGLVPEIALSAEEPPMRIRSDESIAEEQRIAALSASFRQKADDTRWESSQARRAAAKDQQDLEVNDG